MMSKIAFVSLIVALAEARFGQEQIPISAISAVNGGSPGQAATIAGAAVSDLLAATNSCDKLARGDQILADLGTGADAVAAAIGMVAAEKNFNPFTASIPTICDDPTLPANALLRGITPLIDPAVGGSDLANQLSATSKTTPFDATGLSVAGVLKAQGFSNFTAQASDASVTAIEPSGSTDAAAAASTPSSAATAAASGDANTGSSSASPAADAGTCAAQAATNSSTSTTSTTSSTDSSAASAAAAPSSSSVSGIVSTSSLAGADFGKCTPTMKFEGGLGGRPATEFTFQAIDPLVALGQEEALNPNIITNRICDQLTNVCAANQDAKDVCQQAKTQISALGTRDKSTADAWNSALGFAGAVTNPDGGAAEPAASAAAAAAARKIKRTMRRGFRSDEP